MSDLAQRVAEIGVIRPGDKLLIRVQQGTSAEQAKAFSEMAKQALPDVPIVIIAAEQALIVQTGEADG